MDFNLHKINTRDFWDKKIQTWEEGRYSNLQNGGILEIIANYLSSSLRNRLRITAAILKPHIENKTIIELGCGSGLMAEWFIQNGAALYKGYDISSEAIDAAHKKHLDSPLSTKITFERKSILEMPDSIDGDIIFSLGVLDWLKDDELKKVFSLNENKHYLHAISEKRVNLSQYLHRAYVYLAYGFKTNAYVPRYFTIKEMDKYNISNQGMQVYRDKRLSFGALLTSLPIPKVADTSDIPQFGK